MKFDVIIGNPPYQLNDGGNAASAMPIYQKFVATAKKLNPRYLSMVIPARWFTGGRGLDDFRNEMLHDDRIRIMHDFADASDCFPGVEIKGGVCYFLWDRDNRGTCQVHTHRADNSTSQSTRPLLEEGFNTFIRDIKQISVLRKVQVKGEQSFADIISANDPFGFDVREQNSYKRVRAPYKIIAFPGSVNFYYNGWRKDGLGFIEKGFVTKGFNMIDSYKVFVPRVWGTGNPSSDWVNPFVAPPNSCSTETYLAIGPLKDAIAGENVISYMQTKFFHFMVSIIKNTQQAMQRVYTYVPVQDFSKKWTDNELY